MGKDSDVPDRIWIDVDNLECSHDIETDPPDTEYEDVEFMLEYAYVPKLVEKVEAMEIQGNRVQVILDVIEIIKGDG